MTTQTAAAPEFVKWAQSDLNSVRKKGYLLIGQTKVGTVALTHGDGIYTITTQGHNSEVLSTGKLGVVKAALAGLYQN